DPPGAMSIASRQPEPGPIETRVTHSYEPSPRETPVAQAPSLAMAQPFPPSLASVVSQLTAPRQAVPVPTTGAPERGAGRKAAESGAPLAALHSGRAEERSRPSE